MPNNAMATKVSKKYAGSAVPSVDQPHPRQHLADELPSQHHATLGRATYQHEPLGSAAFYLFWFSITVSITPVVHQVARRGAGK
jgi:hypothetical protein